MDFKVAGTTQGVTAIQMDIKMAGITREILAAALAQAKRGRAAILDRMLETIAVPVAELSPYAPRAAVMTIETAKIREVIGAGGKTIRKIIEETGADIDIHEDGMVFISSPDAAGAAQAQQIIADIVRDIAVGEVYDGTVTRLMDFGVFVKLLPGREGLCHISQLADHRVAKVEDVVQPGDRLRVKVVEIDSKGRINLSHKALL